MKKYMGSCTHATNCWERKCYFYAALPLLQQNSQLYDYLRPKFSGLWEQKELNHRGLHLLFFLQLLKKGKRKSVGVCGTRYSSWAKYMYKQKRTRKYMGNQKAFNRRGLIIYLCVKMLMRITHKKFSDMDYKTQKDLYRNLGISWNTGLLLIYVLLRIAFQVTFIAFYSKCTLSFFHMKLW